MKKFIYLVLILISLHSYSQGDMNFSNNTSRTVKFQILSLGSSGSCVTQLFNPSNVYVTVAPLALSTFSSYTSFGYAHWQRRVNDTLISNISPASANSTYGTPNWENFKFLIYNGASLVGSGEVTTNTCVAGSTSWTNGTY